MANFESNTTVDSSTLEKLVAKTVDVVINSSPITLRLLGNQKTWMGKRMKFPIKWQKGVAGTSFDGLQKFSTSRSSSFQMMEFDPTGYEINVVLPQIEVDVNESAKVIDVVARELQSRQEDMIDDIGALFYTVHTAADTNFLSLIDACDDNTLGSSLGYGGLARATYGIQGNYTADAAMTLALLRTKYAACTHGNAKPDLIVTTKLNWARYEVLCSAAATSGQIVYTNTGYPQMTRTGIAPGVQALKGQRGFDVLWFSGAPMVVDETCSANYLMMLNTDHLAFYGLKSTDPDYTPVQFAKGSIDSVYSDVPKTTGFAFSGFQKPIDQYGRVGHIILMGNLISDSPRHLGIEVTYTS